MGNKRKFGFFMIFKSYASVFIGKIIDLHILINDKSNQLIKKLLPVIWVNFPLFKKKKLNPMIAANLFPGILKSFKNINPKR